MDTQLTICSFKLIHKKEPTEVYDDGKYIVISLKPNSFNFETYKH